MKRSPYALFAVMAGISGLALSLPAEAQDCPTRPVPPFRNQEPPGRDLFVPYRSDPAATVASEVRNLQQLRILAEMNKLTVELVKRRSNRYTMGADTPELIKRLKRLAKDLQSFN